MFKQEFYLHTLLLKLFFIIIISLYPAFSNAEESYQESIPYIAYCDWLGNGMIVAYQYNPAKMWLFNPVKKIFFSLP